MKRIDYAGLRKRAGMSQRELAALLQVRPSFLSAIENGKSRMPDEKLDKIKEIFELDSLEDYMMEDYSEQSVTHNIHPMNKNDTLAQLLNHFNDLAHQREREHSGQDAEKDARIDFLTKRNDRLSERIDALRDQVDTLREENIHLKEQLLKNGIQF